ncbi:MAG: hypothetical protein ACXACH_07130, partial [Candidatus Hermodarchaeia archaeon]
MKFTHVGECRPEIMDEKIEEYQPLEHAERLLKSFDHFLGAIKAQQPTILEEYVTNLETRYQPLLNNEYLSLRNDDISPIIDELPHLREYSQLVRVYVNYNFQLLQLSKKAKWKRAKIQTSLRTLMRSRYIPIYTNLQVLTETLPRDQAIQLFKDYIDDYMRMRVAEMDDRYQTLNELRDMFLSMGEWGVVGNVSEVKDGKLIMRRDTCLHNALLADI